jgi:mannose-1-phosphate guanylyltransferase
MSVAVLLHPYTAAAGAETTRLGQASLQHTFGLLAGLATPSLSVLPDGQLPQLCEALRQQNRPAEAILHPGRLAATAGLALAALHQLGRAADPLLLVCPPPLRLTDSEQLQQLMQRARAAADGGAIVSFVTLLPLRGQPAARYQLITAPPAADGSRRVLRVGTAPSMAMADVPPDHMPFHASGACVARASTFLHALALHAPRTLNACRDAMSRARYGKTSIKVPSSPSVRRHSSDLCCTWPDPQPLHLCGAGEIEQQLLLHHPHQVALPSDSSWLPANTPVQTAQFSDRSNRHPLRLRPA